MAMLDMETVLKELEGKDESGGRSLLSAKDLREVRSRFQDYAFTYAKKNGGHTACSGCGGLLERMGQKHGDGILCPRCRKYVKVYDEWRGHRHLYEHMIVYVWKRSRKNPETILAKAIYAEKSFGCYVNPTEDVPLSAHVDAVYQFGPNGARMYRRPGWPKGWAAHEERTTLRLQG